MFTRRQALTTMASTAALVALARPAEAAQRTTVFVAGDSTAATYATADTPRAGWGQALGLFQHHKITIANHALSGASSKSFADLGRLDAILTTIKPHDRLLISFGHNDSKTADPARYTEPYGSYQDYLRRYINGARAKGAQPILVTPVERRRFTEDGHAKTSHGAYPEAMRQLGAAEDVQVIDLTTLSMARWEQLGPEGTKQEFLWLSAGEHPNYPAGVQDNTHFHARGAISLARLIATELPGAIRLDRPFTPSALTWPPTRPAES